MHDALSQVVQRCAATAFAEGGSCLLEAAWALAEAAQGLQQHGVAAAAGCSTEVLPEESGDGTATEGPAGPGALPQDGTVGSVMRVFIWFHHIKVGGQTGK